MNNRDLWRNVTSSSDTLIIPSQHLDRQVVVAKQTFLRTIFTVVAPLQSHVSLVLFCLCCLIVHRVFPTSVFNFRRHSHSSLSVIHCSIFIIFCTMLLSVSSYFILRVCCHISKAELLSMSFAYLSLNHFWILSFILGSVGFTNVTFTVLVFVSGGSQTHN